jgi:Delta3-Delta2-enoyl-CoA isomerase
MLNSLGGDMVTEFVDAMRILNDHPDTIFTIITGEGRFFCSGADVNSKIYELNSDEKTGAN